MGYKRYDIEQDKLTFLLQGYGFTGKGLGKVIAVSPPTGRRRIQSPEDMTVGELRKLMKHIPRDEVLGAL